jgi:hypothetical protein
MGTKEKQEGRGGCGLEATSDNRGEVGREVPFLSSPQTGEKRGKKFVVHATLSGKKRRKVRIEMQGGMTGMWEGHLLQVLSCNETNRKALFSCCKA